MTIEDHQLPNFGDEKERELSAEETLIQDTESLEELAVAVQHIPEIDASVHAMLTRLILDSRTDDLALSKLPMKYGIYEQAKKLRNPNTS